MRAMLRRLTRAACISVHAPDGSHSYVAIFFILVLPNTHRGGKDVYCVRSGPGGLSPRVSGALFPHVAVLGRDRPGKSGWLLSFVGKTVGSDPCLGFG